MFKSSLCCFLSLILCASCVNTRTGNRSVVTGTDTKKISASADPQFRHVVIFKFKEDTSAEKINEVIETFASLSGKINSIKSFEWGTNKSKELTDGFTHCFVVTFANEAGLEEYLNNPDLKEFRKSLSGPLEKALAFDYWTR